MRRSCGVFLVIRYPNRERETARAVAFVIVKTTINIVIGLLFINRTLYYVPLLSSNPLIYIKINGGTTLCCVRMKPRRQGRGALVISHT